MVRLPEKHILEGTLERKGVGFTLLGVQALALVQKNRKVPNKSLHTITIYP